MISYFNIIAAKLAKINLDGQVIHERCCEIHFAPNKEAKEFSEGERKLYLHAFVHDPCALSIRLWCSFHLQRLLHECSYPASGLSGM